LRSGVVVVIALLSTGCRMTQLLDVAMRASPTPAPARDIRVGDRIVLAGDMHCHVLPPDAPWHVTRELPSTLERAATQGLDFVVLTPHVPSHFFEDEDVRGWVLLTQTRLRARIEMLHPSLIVVPGMEYTDYRWGHVGVAFADVREVLAEVPAEDAARRPELFFERWIARGGLLTINHPVERPLPTAPFSQLRADLSWRAFVRRDVPPEIAWITAHAQSVETFNLSITHLRDQFIVGDEDTSLREAAHLVDVTSRAQHRPIAPVGGTDSHGEWLRATTFVLAKERTRDAIRDAIREGRTCVRSPEACTLEVRDESGAWRSIGEHLPSAETIEARARGGEVTFVVNGAFTTHAHDGESTRLPMRRDRCTLVRAIVGRSWSAPVYVGC
jgi:hypothetical protein